MVLTSIRGGEVKIQKEASSFLKVDDEDPGGEFSKIAELRVPKFKKVPRSTMPCPTTHPSTAPRTWHSLSQHAGSYAILHERGSKIGCTCPIAHVCKQRSRASFSVSKQAVVRAALPIPYGVRARCLVSLSLHSYP